MSRGWQHHVNDNAKCQKSESTFASPRPPPTPPPWQTVSGSVTWPLCGYPPWPTFHLVVKYVKDRAATPPALTQECQHSPNMQGLLPPYLDGSTACNTTTTGVARQCSLPPSVHKATHATPVLATHRSAHRIVTSHDHPPPPPAAAPVCPVSPHHQPRFKRSPHDSPRLSLATPCGAHFSPVLPSSWMARSSPFFMAGLLWIQESRHEVCSPETTVRARLSMCRETPREMGTMTSTNPSHPHHHLHQQPHNA